MSGTETATTGTSRADGGDDEALDAILVALWQCETEAGLEYMAAKVQAKMRAERAEGAREALKKAADEFVADCDSTCTDCDEVAKWLRERAGGPELYADELPPIVLHLTPHDVFRALEALREGRGMIAGWVADKLSAAAPEHMRILDATESPDE